MALTFQRPFHFKAKLFMSSANQGLMVAPFWNVSKMLVSGHPASSGNLQTNNIYLFIYLFVKFKPKCITENKIKQNLNPVSTLSLFRFMIMNSDIQEIPEGAYCQKLYLYSQKPLQFYIIVSLLMHWACKGIHRSSPVTRMMKAALFHPIPMKALLLSYSISCSVLMSSCPALGLKVDWVTLGWSFFLSQPISRCCYYGENRRGRSIISVLSASSYKVESKKNLINK